MPIRFRCGYCTRLLAIARRKAGTHTECPHCGATIAVPSPAEPVGSEAPRPELAEIDRLLQADRASNGSAAVAAKPASARVAGPSVPTPAPAPALPDPPVPAPERALFEQDLDAVLGPEEPDEKPQRKKKKSRVESTSDEPLSLDMEPSAIVLTPRKAAALAAAGVVLVILAFVAGYFVGGK